MSLLECNTVHNIIWYYFMFLKEFAVKPIIVKQEGHDGPEVAHLYIGPQSGTILNPRAFI
jgi:hypothetical protein